MGAVSDIANGQLIRFVAPGAGNRGFTVDARSRRRVAPRHGPTTAWVRSAHDGLAGDTRRDRLSQARLRSMFCCLRNCIPTASALAVAATHTHAPATTASQSTCLCWPAYSHHEASCTLRPPSRCTSLEHHGDPHRVAVGLP